MTELNTFARLIVIMNFELFITSRIVSGTRANFSRPVVKLSMVSVALGIAVMIVSVAIVTGFQEQVRNKVIGFGSHIRITGYDLTSSYEENPVSMDQPFYPGLDSVDGIRHIQVFASKAGIIKAGDQIEGVILKGVSRDFDPNYFTGKLLEGRFIQFQDTAVSNEVIISKNLADKLRVQAGGMLRMYFINPGELQPRGRKFSISGIYETGLTEFDELYLFGDIRQIQRLNGWQPDQVGGFEVMIDDFNKLGELTGLVSELAGYDLEVTPVDQLYPQIFEWLKLHDMNVAIIIALMILVAGITMISTLLILIIEKTNMIGTLKALGTKNRSIRKIFIYQAVYIIGQGMIIGNILAFGLTLLQQQTGFLKLNQESYYVPVVPVNLQWEHYIAINAGTLVLCTLMLILPTYIVTRISPVKAIRID